MLLTEAEFDACFDNARFEAFRLEALAEYVVPVETPRFRAYMAGEPYDPDSEPAEWYGYIRDRTATGMAVRKVRVVEGPLGDYERWECEWSYTATERIGQRTYILDAAEVPVLPQLPDYDWWMFDRSCVVRLDYADGVFVGAERLADHLVAEHIRYRDEALAAACPFPDYWATHPQHWRENRARPPA